ncbi:alkylated DNA nucleotide flippase Atl1 [Allocatelliglobosispora scoriae]|uniref:Alkylated DNA nucleotide flippase Atl1 n=1 Tax=Allocatelliglobosispora scoriae TaxID=643052 RepID=A0A841BT49_9ACTN|nr:MGMT family protein [Allocatelliglobosispora scoriae]MBB5871384.1 alkylated DNA nucleotide flippase Atl1 [Allocatelliglobosispora scoriae]
MTPDEYVEAVLEVVERIPPGRVMSYGAIAEFLAEASGRCSPRQVGTIMARHGAAVPWHRVVAGGGRLPPGHEGRATELLRAEGTPLARSGRVIMTEASWWPGTT